MKLRSYFIIVLTLILAALVITQQACKKDKTEESENPTPPTYTNGEGVIGAIGGTITISDQNSPIYGAKIEIPNGALDKNVTIKITDVSSNYSIPGFMNPIIIECTPTGQEFLKAVTLYLPYEERASMAYYYDYEQGIINQMDVISIDENLKLVKTQTSHFSLFFSGEEEVAMDVELVRSNGRLAAYAVILDELHDIPPHRLVNNYDNAFDIAKNESFNTVARFCFTLHIKWPFGIWRPIACKIYYVNWYEQIDKIRVEQSYSYVKQDSPGHELIFAKDVESLDERLNVWMRGFPLLVIFDDESFNDYAPEYVFNEEDEFFVDCGWGLNVPYNPVFSSHRWTAQYGGGDIGEAKKWDDLDEFTLDANDNGIIDSYEEGTGENLPPELPTNISPDDGATNISPNSVTLKWNCTDPNGDIVTYNVLFGTDYPPNEYITENISNKQFTVNNLDPNTEYYWSIDAMDDAETTYGEYWEFTTGSNGGSSLAAPSNVYAGDWNTEQGFGVYWTDNSNNETGFLVEFAINSIDDLYDYWLEPQNSTFSPGIYQSTTNYYWYRVRAVIEDEEGGIYSDYSEYAIVPKSPIDLQAQSNENDILIYWSDPFDSQIQRVYIERSINNTDDFVSIGYVSSPETSFQDFNVSNGNEYYYRVVGSWHGNSADHGSKSLPTNYIGPYTITGGGSGDTFTDPRDGQTYNTVIIGGQEWFAENLNYETGNSWCYDNDGSNCDDYGRLYTWDAAMDGEASSNEVPSGVQGVCPLGWHLPSDDEWKILEMYLGMSQSEADQASWRGTDEGGKMKEAGIIHWNSPNTGATNSSRYTALPGGYRTSNGTFLNLGRDGFWWAATEYDSDGVWSRFLNCNYAEVARGYSLKGCGFGVRCLRD